MKYGLNGTIKPNNDFIAEQASFQSQQPVDSDNSWAQTVQPHGTLTEVNPKVDSHDPWTIAGQPSTLQDTLALGWSDEDKDWNQ